MPDTLTVSAPENNQQLQERAQQLAKKLHLFFMPTLQPKEHNLVLFCDSHGIALWQFQGKRCRFRQVLFVDFLHGENGYRLAHNRTIKQDLAKAIGIKAGHRPTVFDATAGLGRDAFVLASLGCKVFLCERNPIIATLLADGLHRASESPVAQEIVSNITMIHGDSKNTLVTTPCDTIYLDPMYPHTDSNAEKKHSMRLVRQLAGDDLDGDQLMAAAEKNSAIRIAVKRPKTASYISSRVPDHSIVGKSCRYDIYLQPAKRNTTKR